LRNAIKFGLALAAAILLMLAVRAYAFAIYKVTNSNLKPDVEVNDRVVVDKLSRVPFQKGDLVVFHTDSSYIGKLISLPGDTILLNDSSYVLPNTCGCRGCKCVESNCYLVSLGSTQSIIQHHHILGKAYRLSFFSR